MTVDLQIKNPSRFSFDRDRLLRGIEKRLAETRYSTSLQTITVSLLVCNEAEMAIYNQQYHDTKGPTDVLSFPYTDPESRVSDEVFVTPPDTVILGDLIVCYPIARKEAVKMGVEVMDRVEFYVLHGLEHLLGNHHD